MITDEKQVQQKIFHSWSSMYALFVFHFPCFETFLCGFYFLYRTHPRCCGSDPTARSATTPLQGPPSATAAPECPSPIPWFPTPSQLSQVSQPPWALSKHFKARWHVSPTATNTSQSLSLPSTCPKLIHEWVKSPICKLSV